MPKPSSKPSPASSSHVVDIDASPDGYRRLRTDLDRLVARLPPSPLTRERREGVRRKARYSAEAMYLCADLATDPVCVARGVALSRDEVDAKLARATEAKRLARTLRRLAQHVSDDALAVTLDLATAAKLTLDFVDVLASRDEGRHLRPRVDEARAVVRGERQPKTRRRAREASPKE